MERHDQSRLHKKRPQHQTQKIQRGMRCYNTSGKCIWAHSTDSTFFDISSWGKDSINDYFRALDLKCGSTESNPPPLPTGHLQLHQYTTVLFAKLLVYWLELSTVEHWKCNYDQILDSQFFSFIFLNTMGLS